MTASETYATPQVKASYALAEFRRAAVALAEYPSDVSLKRDIETVGTPLERLGRVAEATASAYEAPRLLSSFGLDELRDDAIALMPYGPG